MASALPFTRGTTGTTARGEATEIELHCDIVVMLLMMLLLLQLLDGNGTDDGEAHGDNEDDA